MLQGNGDRATRIGVHDPLALDTAEACMGFLFLSRWGMLLRRRQDERDDRAHGTIMDVDLSEIRRLARQPIDARHRSTESERRPLSFGFRLSAFAYEICHTRIIGQPEKLSFFDVSHEPGMSR